MPFSDLTKQVLTPSPYADYFNFVNQCERNPYTSEHPERPVLMSVAECILNYPLFLENYPKYTELHHGDNEYSSYHGRTYLVESVAKFLTKYAWKSYINPENIVCTCGSAAAMELLACCVCNKGDGVLVISPAYVAFQRDITMRTQTAMYFADTQPDNYKITETVLESCYQRACQEGHKPTMLVYTNPANPMGVTYTKDEMDIVYNFAIKYDLHIFSDEVYALSIDHETCNYISFAKYLEDKPIKDNVTMLWGLSKDFGLSGFRFTTLFTHNETLLKAMKTVNLYYEVPSVAQTVISNMLNDEEYINEHFKRHEARVNEARHNMQSFFDRNSIPYAKSSATFFLWIDLSKYMKENTFEAEMDLWRYLAADCGVVLSPGRCFFSEAPGWYRIVFTINTPEVTMIGLNRMMEGLNKLEL
ncbi:hypothetical protein WA158_008058 [Blastocystis sp. Blastoise]